MDVLADILRVALLAFVAGIGLLAFATGRVILIRQAATAVPASADPAPRGMD
jgi:hypothetical protein